MSEQTKINDGGSTTYTEAYNAIIGRLAASHGEYMRRCNAVGATVRRPRVGEIQAFAHGAAVDMLAESKKASDR